MSNMRNLLDLVNEMSEDIGSVELHDSFDIELSEDFVIETGVVALTEDAIIVEGDDKMLELLSKNGVVLEETQIKEKMLMGLPGDQGSKVMGEDAGMSIEQLATISDKALDDAYHYGRSSPGNTFGWQANLKSAEFAKKAIEAGETDIDKISDAIHRGWNETAKAFVQDPEQFDDTEKLKASGKLEAKLAQREKLMNINYAQLPEDEKEKDRVVARALLQAIKGGGETEQNVDEGSHQMIDEGFIDTIKQKILPKIIQILGPKDIKTVSDKVAQATGGDFTPDEENIQKVIRAFQLDSMEQEDGTPSGFSNIHERYSSEESGILAKLGKILMFLGFIGGSIAELSIGLLLLGQANQQSQYSGKPYSKTKKNYEEAHTMGEDVSYKADNRSDRNAYKSQDPLAIQMWKEIKRTGIPYFWYAYNNKLSFPADYNDQFWDVYKKYMEPLRRKGWYATNIETDRDPSNLKSYGDEQLYPRERYIRLIPPSQDEQGVTEGTDEIQNLKDKIKKLEKQAENYSFEPGEIDPKSGHSYRPNYVKTIKQIKELKNKLKQLQTKQGVDEAEYQGREVPLGKPMAGDVKKSKVYVRKPNGNVVKVNFGDKKMRIKKSNPKRRKSFRARHHCENPGPRWKARYWSCRAW